MNEAVQPVAGEIAGLRAQAGKLLCMSETIFPAGSRHVEDMLRGEEAGNRVYPTGLARPSRRGGATCGGEPWKVWER